MVSMAAVADEAKQVMVGHGRCRCVSPGRAIMLSGAISTSDIGSPMPPIALTADDVGPDPGFLEAEAAGTPAAWISSVHDQQRTCARAISAMERSQASEAIS